MEFDLLTISILLAGIAYGFFVGLIPVAGATTGLIAVYSFVGLFADPYHLVIFTTAVVVTSSIGDSFCSIVMNIPGAGGAAPPAVYPLFISVHDAISTCWFRTAKLYLAWLESHCAAVLLVSAVPGPDTVY